METEHVVRTAHPTDEDALHGLAEGSRESMGIKGEMEQRFETCFQAALSDPHTRILVGEVGEQVLGYLTIWKRPTIYLAGPVALIDEMAVAAEAEDLAQPLLEAAAQYAREWGCLEISLSPSLTEIRNKAIFKQMGYEESGRGWRKGL